MKTAQPKEHVIEFRQTVYLCANGEHDSYRVYLWRGKWCCRTCLKVAVRQAGGTSRDVNGCASPWANCSPAFRAEDVRDAAPMQRITPCNDLPKKLEHTQIRKEFCDGCGGTHRVGECPL